MEEYFKYSEKYFNIYQLDDDPDMSARAHHDRHLNRAIVDCGRILSTVWFEEMAVGEDSATGLYLDWGPSLGQPPYGALTSLNAMLCGQRIIHPTPHAKHPCIEWARLYGGNYLWLYRHACALLDELRLRLGRIHSVLPAIRALEQLPPRLNETSETWCDVPTVMPPEFIKDSSVESYKAFYRKEPVLVYTKRMPPAWLPNATFIDGD